LRGFAELKPGLHVRPDNFRGGVRCVREQLAALGLSPAAIVFRMTELDDAALAHAAGLWKAESLIREYASLTAVLDARLLALHQEGREEVLKNSLLLGRQVIALVIRDPLLPLEIMSQQPRRALVQAVLRYQDEARRLWRDFLAEAGSA
jgi:phenylacetic acid degradation operon negative regulatory protein